MASTCYNDDHFGPTVQGCRDDFDFTQKFENIALKLVPAAIFAAIALVRIVHLVPLPKIVDAGALLTVKLVTAAVSIALNLTMLTLGIIERSLAQRNLFILAYAVTLVGSLCLLPLSYFEHSKSPRPSIILNAYLLITLLFDIAQVRTLWLEIVNQEQRSFASILASYVAVKAIMLVFEAQSKGQYAGWNTKEYSPEESSGLYSLSAFFWLNSLFFKGYRTTFRVQDLFPLVQALESKELSLKFQVQLEKRPLNGQRLGLASLLLRTLAVNLFFPVPPRLALIGFQFCQPFLIRALLDYLQTNPDSVSNNHGYGLIGASILIYGGIAISNALYWYYQERAMSMGRGMLVSALYRKSTQTNSLNNSAPLTLMSTDVERIRLGLVNMHEFWASTIEAALACWLLQKELGAAFTAAFILIILAAVSSYMAGKLLGRYQRTWMETIEKRVTLTASVITHMKSIKISGLAQPIESLVHNMRLDELKAGRRWRRMVTLSVTISYSPLLLSPVLAFAVNSQPLDTTSLFLTVSYLTLFTTPLCMLLQKLPQLLGAFTCLHRIQIVLEQESRVDSRSFRNSVVLSREKSATDTPNASLKVPSSNGSFITITNGSFGWGGSKDDLTNINITIPKSKLTMITGPVASGKSTLAKALLGEVPRARGQISMGIHCCCIGYCDQSPYLLNKSIRDNIIGFIPFDEKLYHEVTQATMLLRDFSELPQGDLTKVGSGGILLSGGQRQRVAIARVLYTETNLLIFDNALSGLDASTDKHVFDRVFGIGGILRCRDATIIMCTNSHQHLLYADNIIVLNEHGTVAEQKLNDHSSLKRDATTSSISTATQQELEMRKIQHFPATDITALPQSNLVAQSIVNEDKSTARQTGNKSIYRYYFSTIGLLPSVGFILVGICWGFFYNFPQIWLKYWADDLESQEVLHSSPYYIGIYSLLQTLSLASITTAVFIVMSILVSMSGSELHRRALQAIINAPLQLLGDTDVGVITNLFSQDMTLVDGELPVALNNFILTVFQTVGMAAVLASSSPWLILTYPVLLLVLWGLQMFYLRTSRQLRLLSLEASGPLYSHFIDTMNGIATIRAFGWVQQNIKENDALLNISQRPTYLLAMIQKWLLLALNLVVMFIALIVITMSTQLRTSSGFAGASLVTLMGFGLALSNIVKFYASMETSIGAVARIKDFCEKTTSETQVYDTAKLDNNWPDKGNIEIQGVSAYYGMQLRNDFVTAKTGELALSNIDVCIQSREKVAICGRTGSGKSSILLLLLRLLDPLQTAHVLRIDGVPVEGIDRSTLRRRLIALPQDAVFLPDGTPFRLNLDPLELCTIEECRSTLEAVCLLDFIERRGGLGAGMTPNTLSHGQKQLFSLARAVLRRRVRFREMNKGTGLNVSSAEQPEGGILLLDEFSSSVDHETDRVMQDIIMREFQNYTVIMVSHRLDMVLNICDRVIVMDHGCIVENGNPRSLQQTAGSRFAELTQASGLV